MRHQSYVSRTPPRLLLSPALLPNGTSRSKPETEIQSLGHARSFERIVMQISFAFNVTVRMPLLRFKSSSRCRTPYGLVHP